MSLTDLGGSRGLFRPFLGETEGPFLGADLHSEIDDTPLACFLAGPVVTRPCPDTAALRLAFTRAERRTLRKSDGTVAPK